MQVAQDNDSSRYSSTEFFHLATSNKDVTHLSHILTPLALSIMLITIAMLGLMMMTGKRIQISNVLVNLILAICFISITPYLFHTLSTMTLQFQQDQEKIPAQLSYSKEDELHRY